MHRLYITLLLLSGSLLQLQTAHADFVFNGSFEANLDDLGEGVPLPTNGLEPPHGIAGWSGTILPRFANGKGNPGKAFRAGDNDNHIAASNGKTFLVEPERAFPAFSRIKQNIAGVSAGKYRLSFDAMGYGDKDALLALVSVTPLASSTNTIHATAIFSETQNSSDQLPHGKWIRIEEEFALPEKQDLDIMVTMHNFNAPLTPPSGKPGLVGIDNVQLKRIASVPEPSSISLLLFGGAAFFLSRRRKQPTLS